MAVQPGPNDKYENPAKAEWVGILSAMMIFVCIIVGAIEGDKFIGSHSGYNVEKATSEPAQNYTALRSRALNIKPGQFNLKVDANTTQPYGIVMDWGMSDGVMTLESFINGDANAYTSQGDVVPPSKDVAKIHTAATTFVAIAGDFVTSAQLMTDFPTPAAGYIRFYILTPHGIYGTTDVDETYFNFDGVNFKRLFDAANLVLRALQSDFQKKQSG